jgi:hypothetical protein
MEGQSTPRRRLNVLANSRTGPMPGLQRLIKQMLATLPHERPSVSELLEHPLVLPHVLLKRKQAATRPSSLGASSTMGGPAGLPETNFGTLEAASPLPVFTNKQLATRPAQPVAALGVELNSTAASRGGGGAVGRVPRVAPVESHVFHVPPTRASGFSRVVKQTHRMLHSATNPGKTKACFTAAGVPSDPLL